MIDDEAISEVDVRKLLRLVGGVARLKTPLAAKRRTLLEGAAELAGADKWSWILAKASDENDNPAIAAYMHGGHTPEEIARSAVSMQDRRNTPVEYQSLNQLRLSHVRFTRTWDQLVPQQAWYGPANAQRLKSVGFEHVMYSVRVLGTDGLFSGISFMRRFGRENFGPRERRLVHVLLGEVDWIHYDGELRAVAHQVGHLAPRVRSVLLLLLEGLSVKQIATRLSIRPGTVMGYTKALHRHFKVNSRGELLRRFIAGDGGDIESGTLHPPADHHARNPKSPND
jgi:DNA-binding CsgD family transcriptional regulator